MCTQCVAQGAAYVVPGLVAMRLWSRGRARRRSTGAVAPVAQPAERERASSSG